MEMSFVPTPKSAKDEASEKKADRIKKNREKADRAQFGAGMEKRQDMVEEEEEALEGEEESGRTKMRKPMRSASRNVTRKL